MLIPYMFFASFGMTWILLEWRVHPLIAVPAGWIAGIVAYWFVQHTATAK